MICNLMGTLKERELRLISSVCPEHRMGSGHDCFIPALGGQAVPIKYPGLEMGNIKGVSATRGEKLGEGSQYKKPEQKQGISCYLPGEKNKNLGAWRLKRRT